MCPSCTKRRDKRSTTSTLSCTNYYSCTQFRRARRIRTDVSTISSLSVLGFSPSLLSSNDTVRAEPTPLRPKRPRTTEVVFRVLDINRLNSYAFSSRALEWDIKRLGVSFH